MTPIGLFQIFLYFVILVALTKPLGLYMERVFSGERTFAHPVLRPFERLIYKISGIDEAAEQRWTYYAISLLAFSLVGILLTYLIQRIQGMLPFNPQAFGGKLITPDLAFNTAVSFGTNTNWQAYTPETTVSYFTQMVGLAVHNFTSAAAGIATAIALVRGFSRRSAGSIGNFWVDVTRATLYVLLPIAIVAALVLVSQGCIQNLHPYDKITTLEGAAQTIAQGPVASQEAIKMLGTNGGGFFNANSAHPFENPTPFSNFFQMLLIFLIPAGLTYTFGKMVKDTRQGWALFAAMSIVFLAGVFVVYPAEQAGNPNLTKLGVQSEATAVQSGGNMEGKEVRFGIPASSLLRRHHHRRQLRRRQQHARQLHPPRRTRAAGQHPTRRSHLRRRRRGSLRHAHVRHPGRLHRRTDGRPHPRIPGQENRTERSEDGHARHARPRRQHPALLRRPA